MYSTLVLELGLSPKYVLDEIEVYEINSLILYSYKKHKDEWEQARLISYLIAQSNSTKKLKLEDIVRFQWEKRDEKNNTDESLVSKSELEEMMREADEMKKIMFGE